MYVHICICIYKIWFYSINTILYSAFKNDFNNRVRIYSFKLCAQASSWLLNGKFWFKVAEVDTVAICCTAVPLFVLARMTRYVKNTCSEVTILQSGRMKLDWSKPKFEISMIVLSQPRQSHSSLPASSLGVSMWPNSASET